MPLWGIGESRDKDLVSGGITRATASQPHLEFPTNLRDVDEAHGNDRQGAFGDDATNFETTATSGPNGTSDPDGGGPGHELETDTSAADHLIHCVARGAAGRKGSDRLDKGSRGRGFHYEYEYIDSNGRHRRRHECLVATRTNVETAYGLDPDITNASWSPGDTFSN